MGLLTGLPFVLRSGSGLWVPSGAGAVTPAPGVASISPSVGDLAGGYAATITGTNFTGATGATIGGVAVTSFVVVNATTITCLVPAGTTGAKNVVVTGPGGSGTGTNAFRYFSPAQLTDTQGWWRGSYTAPGADPRYAGTASSGGSGARPLNQTSDLDAIPTTGTAQNGIVPAVLGGSNALETAATVSAFFSNPTGSIVQLLYPTAAAVDGVSLYDDPCFLGDASSIYLSYSASGFGFYSYDNTAGGGQVGRLAAALNTWWLVQIKWDGAHLRMRLNGGAWTPVAWTGGGDLAGVANTLRLGKNPFVAFAEGSHLETILGSTAWSDSTFNDFLAYARTRHALALT